MFEFLKKKSPLEKLDEAYKKCLKEAFHLSKTNRKTSDEKAKEANTILLKIEALKQQQL